MSTQQIQREGPTTNWLGVIIVVAIFGAYGLYVLTGLSVNRIVCGESSLPESVLAPVGFFFTGDTSVFGTANGCSAETSTTVMALIAVFVVGLVITFTLLRWRHRYLQSDRAFLKMLRRREGLARNHEIKKMVGTKATKARVKKVRPTLKHPKPEQGALLLGESEGSNVWSSLEESICLIGPPRSGKGLHLLVGAILDAPGPVISTSSRADNYAMTKDIRERNNGPVTLFDPQGLTGHASTLKWSPITGCDVPQVADQRATSLIESSGLDGTSSNSEWKNPAVLIMECLLHAAALDGRSVDDLMRWGTNPAEAKDAVNILAEHPKAAKGWHLTLQGIIDGDPKLLQNKWFGVESAVKGLVVPEVREVMKPESAAETFNIDEFIEQCGTLYIIGTKAGGSSAGPFLIAMMDAITQRGREIAAKRKGNRLDPPMSLVLDEIANISGAWPGLVTLMADGGGVGISPFAVFQSMAQCRNEWGEQAASALFDAATVKMQLGGASNTQDLEVFAKLAGQRKVVRASQSYGGGYNGGSSFSDQVQNEDVFSVDELRRLPFGWGILLNRNGRPVLMEMCKWPDRRDAKAISASAGNYSKALQEELESGEDVLSSISTASDRPDNDDPDGPAAENSVPDALADIPVR